jgi:hypothetical protein
MTIHDPCQLLLIGQVLLLMSMFSGAVDMGAFVRASEAPQCAISASDSGTRVSDESADAYTGSIASWHHQRAKLYAKVPKAKSALLCHQWALVTPTLSTPFSLRAGLPLHALVATQCYAIHPRPPSFLPA